MIFETLKRARSETSAKLSGLARSQGVVAFARNGTLLRADGGDTAAAIEERSVVTRKRSSRMQAAEQAVQAIARNALAITGSIDDVSRVVETTKEAARVLAR